MSPTPARRSSLSGHRPTTLGRSPFWSAAPAIVAALVYAAAAIAWVLIGDLLPGGRWLAVHLFTLGVLSNLVLTFSQHFGHTVTRAPGDGARWITALLNVGVLATLVGVTQGTDWLTGSGATVATAAVTASYVRLRRARRAAVGARFAWIARVYERAHGAFIHGAILGFLLGLGLLPGEWYLSGRLAHLHINVLGWGGLTLMATLVFFGPTIVRTRIEPGADATAARALRHGATALTVAVLALLASGLGGVGGTVLRVLAGIGFGGFALATTLVVTPVVRAAVAAKPSAPRPLLVALSLWFAVVVWVDAVVVTAGAWRFLDLVGVVALVGVLAQAIASTLTYLAPMLRGRSFTARDALMARLERGAMLRAVALNGGVLLVVAGGLLDAAGAEGLLLTRAGWALVVAAFLHLAALGLAPVRVPDDGEARSSVARRYRDEDGSA